MFFFFAAQALTEGNYLDDWRVIVYMAQAVIDPEVAPLLLLLLLLLFGFAVPFLDPPWSTWTTGALRGPFDNFQFFRGEQCGWVSGSGGGAQAAIPPPPP